jgi:hypothetical protein
VVKVSKRGTQKYKQNNESWENTNLSEKVYSAYEVSVATLFHFFKYPF